MLRRLILAIGLAALCAGSTAVARQQSADFFFVQLADPQFGAFTSDKDFAQETANYEFAVANINRLRPKFVVICGDLINKVGDPAQSAEYFRITRKIDPGIPVYAVAGNHDVGNDPTPETLAYYREHFGKDYYSFREGNLYGIVLDSSVISSPAKVQVDADRQEAWLEEELERAKASGARHIVVFQHHSWFLEKADEATGYFNIPIAQRARYLALLKGAGVRYVFSGHYHRNAFGKDGDLEMITNGPVGRPLGKDPSGMRIVTVRSDRLEHRYLGFGEVPNQFSVEAPVAPR
ncbi:MAG TPA: metallophosphoesterase [Terriglobia bacterium]|nr:metallophosphoesterase [Terriglobia bacterium]